MGTTTISILVGLIGIFVGGTAAVAVNRVRMKNAATKMADLIENAKKEAEQERKELLAEAKEEANKYKEEIEKELKDKKSEIKESEDRVLNREKNIDRRDESLQKKEDSILQKENELTTKQKQIQEEQLKVEELKNEQLTQLEKISKLSKTEAHDEIIKRVEDMMSLEIASLIKEREEEAKLTADKKAKNLLVESMQKYAADVSNEQTVTVVDLPSDDLKGRIIGREGRNIRTIEAVTGVDLIIDDTPEAIVLSSFDPFRREIAKITIETLIKDGRIHPARIEELYDKTVKEMSSKVREYGEEALFELGITKVDAELVEILGKLHFRTSYGQNALQHSIEVASLAGVLASEIGENENLAKRAGIFHDIGKAIDHEVEGSHVDLGSEIARKYHESEVVIDGIESHHGDTEAKSIIAELVAIADALSASRPGARNDSLENYVKRLQELEAIGNNISGVEKTYAIQAGRELRVIVKPEEIDDLASYKVARDIKEKVEAEMQYPGTIKITVIRETRATEEAK